MDKAKPFSTPMVRRSLNVDNDHFALVKTMKKFLVQRFSSSPTKRHLNGIKHILRYLRGTVNLGLFYPNDSKEGLVGYADVGYLSDPHKARFQTEYVFLNGGTAILWRSKKQTLVATSSNHAEVIALHKASIECVSLRSITHLILTSCGLKKDRNPTLFYEDSSACVSKMKEGYVKSDRTKHIPPRFLTRQYSKVELRFEKLSFKGKCYENMDKIHVSDAVVIRLQQEVLQLPRQCT
ncbi:hypothetical protein Tco_0980804 [Tanacetum coccineum]